MRHVVQVAMGVLITRFISSPAPTATSPAAIVLTGRITPPTNHAILRRRRRRRDKSGPLTNPADCNNPDSNKDKY
jgi:hypothetical protein